MTAYEVRISYWSSDVCSADLFLSRGCLHRLDAARGAALFLTILSFILALPKGIAIGEMVMLAFLFIMLLATRREFYRRASLFAQSFSIGWFIAVGCLVAGVIWVLFFVYRDVPYGNRSEEHTSELQFLMRISYAVIC